MTPRVLFGVLAGSGVAAGLVLIWAGVTGHAVARLRRRRVPWVGLLTGLGVGLVVLALTRWVAVALALGLLAARWRSVLGGTRTARTAIIRLEALAGWTESLRDMVATGLALPEALPASVAAASPVIAPQLTTLADRLAAREGLDPALRALAADLDDTSADLVIAALLLNAHAQGRQLHAVLSALARSTRAELTVRRAVEAERRATRRGVRIVLAVTVGMALGLDLLNPTYLAPYRTMTGQVVLAGVVAVFVAGFVWLTRLARIPTATRFLGPVEAGARATGSVEVTG